MPGTTDIRLDILYKKFALGIPTAYPNGDTGSEAGFDKPMIFPSLQIISQTIPNVAPTADLSNVTITYLNPTVSGTNKQVSIGNTYVAKYTNLPLIDVGGGTALAFGYSKTQSLNLCTQAIPFNYDLTGGSYIVRVFDSTNTEIYSNNSTYPWAFDGDAGVLLFTGGTALVNKPPSITFWRYEGTFGGSSGGTAVSGNLTTLIGDVSFNGNVTVSGNIGIGKANPKYPIDTPGIASCGAVFQFDATSGVNTLNTAVVGGVYSSQNLVANAGITIPNGQTLLNNGVTTLNGLATLGGGLTVSGGIFTVNSGATINGNATITGNTIHGNTAVFLSDVSINGRLLIATDVSLNRGLNILGNLTLGSVSQGSGYAIAALDIRPPTVGTNTSVGTTLGSFSGITSGNTPALNNRVNINLSSYIDVSGLPTNSVSTIDDGAGSGALIFSSKTGYNTAAAAMTERMRITSAGQVGIGTLNTVGATYALDINGNTNIRNNLYIQGNIIVPVSGTHSITGNLVTTTSTTGTSIVTGNESVFGTETISGILTASGGIVSGLDASFNTRLFVGGDVSMGGRLYVQGDTSLNGNLTIRGALNVQQLQNQSIINTTTTNYQLIISEDLSLNGRLYTSGDASFSSRLFVQSDASINGNLNIAKNLRPTTISEPFSLVTSTPTNYIFDYSTGSTFYINNNTASNFSGNIINVPSDVSRTYVATLIINAALSGNKTFCNSVQVNTGGAITPQFANGIPASITSGNIITQSIAIQRNTVGNTAGNLIVLSAVTAWY